MAVPKIKRALKSGWKKNVRKEKRLKGEEYVGFRNVIHPGRPLLPVPCADKNNHDCSSLITGDTRSIIYKEFRSLESLEKQRQFVLSHVEQTPKKRTTRNIVNSRKKFTNHYFLTVKGEKKVVCREFFMATINVTDAFIRGSLAKKTMEGFLESDKRGKHIPHNKLTDGQEAFIRNHILSFPAVESHYCRKNTNRRYLDSQLNISMMHRLYQEKCSTENQKSASLVKYRRIFKSYNLGFFKPKKDQCKKCLAFSNLSEDKKKEERPIYQEHLEKKDDARKCRDSDKAEAKENIKTLAFNFDMQAVLSTPKGPAGQIFYLRKLAVYNLTIYNLGSQDVCCYLWDEIQGNRGSNEISSCIFDYMMKQSSIITNVRMMSDGCGGQQKNSIFALMCLHAVINHRTLETIDHKFFQTGHTEMECDSIHSKIEKKSKFVPVYVPEGWAQLIRDARVNPRPFEVRTLTYKDIFDFKAFSSKYKVTIPWRNICWLHYEKNEPTKIFYKTSFRETNFKEIDLKKYKIRHQNIQQLEKAYQANLPISEAKFKDLQKMCQDGTIPAIHHPFYNSLSVNKKIRDKLPEPDFSEESEYE